MLAAMALGQPRCEPLPNDPALLCFCGSSRVNFVERSESLLARSTNFLHSLKASCNHFFSRCRALPERQWMLSSLATSVFAAVQRGLGAVTNDTALTVGSVMVARDDNWEAAD